VNHRATGGAKDLKKKISLATSGTVFNKSDSVRKTIRNPFNANVADVPEDLREAVIVLQNNMDRKDMFEPRYEP